MIQELSSAKEATRRISAGANLLLAGDERVLGALPRGTWVGGTIPYFMAREGGTFSEERVFVTELPAYCKSQGTRVYSREGLAQVYTDIPNAASASSSSRA